MRTVVALCLGACGAGTLEVSTVSPPPPDGAVATMPMTMRAPATDAPPADLPPIGEALPCSERVPAFRTAMSNQWPEHHHRRVDLPDVKVWKSYTPGRTVVVEIDASGKVTIDGQSDRLRARLAEAARFARDEDGVQVRPLDVLADKAAPAKAVYRVMAAAPKSLEPRLVVDRAVQEDEWAVLVLPPGAGGWVPAWLAEMRTATEPSVRYELLQTALTRASGTSCPALPLAYQAVAATNPAERDRTLRTQLPAAIETCECAGVDPFFETLAVASSSFAPNTGWLALPRTAKKLPATTVADLAAALAH